MFKIFKYWLLKKVANLLMLLHLSQFLRIKRKDFVLRFYPSHCSKVLWLKQYVPDERYTTEERFLRAYLRPSDVVIDAGANIGFLTMLCSVTVGASGKVYAFEPHPTCFKYLSGNLELNKVENVLAFNVALGDENRLAQFSTTQKKDDHNFMLVKGSGAEIPLRRLDSVGITANSIALLKIDVEGYEKFVIKGAGCLLERIQCIYFEAVDYALARFDYNITDLCTSIKNAGFEIFDINDRRLQALSANLKKPSSNLIATRNVQAFLNRIQLHC